MVFDMHEGCKKEVRCAVGTAEAFSIEVGLHQGSGLSPFLFTIIMNSLTKRRRLEPPWQMMFANDVALCAREKEVLEVNLEQWRVALVERGMKISRSKTEYIRLSGSSLGSVYMQDSQLQVTDNFKYF